MEARAIVQYSLKLLTALFYLFIFALLGMCQLVFFLTFYAQIQKDHGI
jgi:hypothetical protein